MKLVKEHIIFEKFTEDSDPIKDLGIGILDKIEKEFEGKVTLVDNKDGTVTCYYAISYLPQYIPIDIAEAASKYNVIVALKKFGWKPDVIHQGNKFLKVDRVVMKFLLVSKDEKTNENLNEKFTEDSDPIQDMGIGLMHEIDEWIKQKNYVRNRDITMYDRLYYSVRHNKEEYVEFVLPKIEDKQLYKIPFNNSIRLGNINIVKTFIENGVIPDVYSLSDVGFGNPIYRAAVSAKYKILQYFFEIAKQQNVKVPQNILDHCLYMTCNLVYTNSARVLLDNGAQINEPLKANIRRWILKNKKVKVLNMLKERGLLTQII